MSFAAQMFGSDTSSKLIAKQQQERLSQLEADTLAQQKRVAEEQDKADRVAAAQRRILGGKSRGLLRYAEPSTDVLGTSGA